MVFGVGASSLVRLFNTSLLPKSGTGSGDGSLDAAVVTGRLIASIVWLVMTPLLLSADFAFSIERVVIFLIGACGLFPWTCSADRRDMDRIANT